MSGTALIFQLGLTLVFVALAAIGILWAIKNGQYDDLEGPAQRILMDDDDPKIPFNSIKNQTPSSKTFSNKISSEVSNQSGVESNLHSD